MCVINHGCLKCCRQPLCEALFSCIIAFFEFFPSALSSRTKKCEEVKITWGINHRLSVFSLKEHILCSTTNRPFHYSTAARLIKDDKQELQAATCSLFTLQSFFRYSPKPTNSDDFLFCLVQFAAHPSLLSFSQTWPFSLGWDAIGV